jgi:hypothetical protein
VSVVGLSLPLLLWLAGAVVGLWWIEFQLQFSSFIFLFPLFLFFKQKQRRKSAAHAQLVAPVVEHAHAQRSSPQVGCCSLFLSSTKMPS